MTNPSLAPLNQFICYLCWTWLHILMVLFLSFHLQADEKTLVPQSATKAGGISGSLLLQDRTVQKSKPSRCELLFLLKKKPQVSTETHLGNGNSMLALLNTAGIISTQDCPSQAAITAVFLHSYKHI